MNVVEHEIVFICTEAYMKDLAKNKANILCKKTM